MFLGFRGLGFVGFRSLGPVRAAPWMVSRESQSVNHTLSRRQLQQPLYSQG